MGAEPVEFFCFYLSLVTFWGIRTLVINDAKIVHLLFTYIFRGHWRHVFIGGNGGHEGATPRHASVRVERSGSEN